MKSKKLKKKILESLKEKAPLSTNRGRYLAEKYPKPSKKTRRHSGRYTPKIVNPKMKYSEIIMKALEPKVEWDCWIDYRDGLRDTKKLVNPNVYWYDEDKEKAKQKRNKIKKKEKIRKVRKKFTSSK